MDRGLAYIRDGSVYLHDNTTPDYAVGGLFGQTWRNYFVFDLAGQSGTLLSATVRIQNIGTGVNLANQGNTTYTLWDVTTGVQLLMDSFNNAGGALVPIYNDLGSGTAYGSVNLLHNTPGYVDIVLNAAALTAVQAAVDGGVRFAVGGSLTGAGSDYAFWGLGTRQIILNFEDGPGGGGPPPTGGGETPEISTMFALGSGLAVFAYYRRTSGGGRIAAA
jgi:hypothetical protein